MEENFSGMRDALEQEMQQKLEEKLAENPEKQATVQAEKDALEAFYKEQLQEVEMAKVQYIAQQEREREAREAAMLDREKELIHKITAIESQKACERGRRSHLHVSRGRHSSDQQRKAIQDGGVGKRGRVTELGDWVTVKWDDSSSS